MGVEKYVSQVKVIPASDEAVYAKLSDLKNLEPLFDPDQISALKDKVPNAPDIKLENFEATPDECSFTINPLGRVSLQIIERDPNKLVKLSGGQGLPFNATCWLQFVQDGEQQTKVRVTIHADLNPMIKMLVGKYLTEGVDRIADALTRIPY